MVGFHLQRCWALSSFPFYSVSRDTTQSVVRATAGIGVDDDHCEDRNAHWQSILGNFKMQPKRLIRIKTPPSQYLQSWSWGQTIIMQPQGWQCWPQLGTWTLEHLNTWIGIIIFLSKHYSLTSALAPNSKVNIIFRVCFRKYIITH